MAIVSQNPATEEIIKEFAALTSEEVEQKISRAHRASAQWKSTSLAERSALMRTVAQTLRQRSREFAALMTVEMGKITPAGLAEVEKCAITCEYYADNAEAFLQEEPTKTDASESYVRFDPIGIVLAVMPWNFPFWQVFRFAAPALMAGNVGLLKHASNVPQCALAIEEIFLSSGFPEGVFQTLLVPGASTDAIIRDDRVAAVTLTGSESAGSQVAATAGKMIKKTVLELGGSDPFIVLEDANLERAAQIGVQARLQNNVGQSCIAAKRFIVHEAVAERFTQLLAEQFQSLIIGNPLESTTQVGPMASAQMLETIISQVQNSIAKGAVVACGGKRWGEKGFYYEPTVLTNVTAGMPVYDEEVFGPVAPIIVTKSKEEAVAIANSSPYGLGATVFTESIATAKEMARKIESGAVFINGMVRSDQRLPFGGIKKSGYGRELGSYGIREFVNIKTVVVMGDTPIGSVTSVSE